MIIKITIGILVNCIVFIPAAILSYREQKKYNSNLDINNYTMRQPVYISVIFGFCAAFFIVFIVLFTLFSEETPEIWFYLFFGSIVLVLILFIVYCIKWEIVIDKDIIKKKNLFKRNLNFTFYDINLARQYQDSIIVYLNNKQAIKVYHYISGYRILQKQLNYYGKIAVNNYDFSVKRDRSICWVGFIDVLLFGGLLVWQVSGTDISEILFEVIIFSIFITLGLVLIIYAARWKIIFNDFAFAFYPAIGKKSVFLLKDIKSVSVDKSAIILYLVNDNTIKVHKGYIGFSLLIEFLKRNRVTFTYVKPQKEK